MKDLSIIVPFVNEFPQVIYTIRGLIEELKGLIDFEVIAIDNYCKEEHNQRKTVRIRKKDAAEPEEITSYQFPDRGGDMVKGSQRANNGILRYYKYDQKLSHWNAKNVGIREAEGEFLYFADAHVLPSKNSIFNMYRDWLHSPDVFKATINLPLTYKILDTKGLIYKLIIEDDGTVHYKFTPLRGKYEPFEVPCMSACGVLMHRSIMDKLGGQWPELLGIYGGGENFLNFTLRTLGVKSYIYPDGRLFHYGNPREYYYNGDDYTRNRALANYFIGGVDYMDQFLKARGGSREVLDKIREQILDGCYEQAQDIHAKNDKRISIQTWVEEAISRDWLNDKKMIDIFRRSY